jgi:hypothetical protein
MTILINWLVFYRTSLLYKCMYIVGMTGIARKPRKALISEPTDLHHIQKLNAPQERLLWSEKTLLETELTH